MLKKSVVCSLYFTLSLHFTPGLMSKVCNPHSAFTMTIQRMDILKKGERRGMEGEERICNSLEYPLLLLQGMDRVTYVDLTSAFNLFGAKRF